MSSTSYESAPPPLIAGLLWPKAYDHPVDSIHLCETHISWVLLAGNFAYKIKKPVDLGFLDFSALERRHFFCKEELRLNQRYAPDLYLSVATITGTPERPRVYGTGPPIEYAVQMRRFDEALLFDRLIRTHLLLPEYSDRLAETLASFHAASARAAPNSPLGLPSRQQQLAELNFSMIRPSLGTPDNARLDILQDWTCDEYRRKASLLLRRKTEGFIRECHGDLHLGNIVLINGHPTPFDCIEFSEDLRWIDVLSELAFLMMDLEVNGASAFAWRLLNRYLEITGDYAGLTLFNYFRVYRAMVRAKVALLTRAQTQDSGKKAKLLAQHWDYVSYCFKLIRPQKPRLFITHGLSGSGKSYLAALLGERLPAIRIRSDVERKRLAELNMKSDSESLLCTGLYSEEMTGRTYDHLSELAETLLGAGYTVIVDATFLKRIKRDEFKQIADRIGAGFLILDCRASVDLLRERIHARMASRNDPSDADLSVLDYQLTQEIALDKDEQAWTLGVEMDKELVAEQILKAIAMS